MTDVSLVSECGDYTPLIADPGPGIYRLKYLDGKSFKNSFKLNLHHIIYLYKRSRTRLCVPGSKSVPVTPVASHAHRRRRLLRRSETVEDYNKVKI